MAEFNDFVMVMDDFLPDDLCDSIIDDFNYEIGQGFGTDRAQCGFDENKVKDMSTGVDGITRLKRFSEFSGIFWGVAYPEYLKKYSVLSQCRPHTMYYAKVQRTRPTEGYHVWHCETMGRGSSDRLLSYIVYLDDVEEGGETEFLYQSLRIKAKKGTLVLFPGGFTHTHRGNPPLSGDKHILTGWIEFEG